MDQAYKEKAAQRIEKNRLIITKKHPAYNVHIKSIDKFIRKKFQESYELSIAAKKICVGD